MKKLKFIVATIAMYLSIFMAWSQNTTPPAQPQQPVVTPPAGQPDPNAGGQNAPTTQQPTVLDRAYVKDNFQTRRVIPLTFLREADMMWSKRVWRIIDLHEKINLPLYYPPSKQTKDRRSLINVLMDAIKEGGLTAYKITDDEFTYPMTKAEVDEIGIFGKKIDTIYVADVNNPDVKVAKTINREFNPDDVIGYRVKEDWVFDRQRSVIDVRILGIAPMILDKDDQGQIKEGGSKKIIFWVYFPEARRVLANAEVFNRFNDSERKTFDDIFLKRMFNSYIIKESNVYDRKIQDYKTGLDALLEAEKIKLDMVNFEHDLWEY